MGDALRQIDVGVRSAAAPPRAAAEAGAGERTEIAIVGLGAWGLCLLERLLGTVRRAAHRGRVREVDIHVIEPNRPGAGVYASDGPDYFLINTPCGQVSLSAWDDAEGRGGPDVGLFEWARGRGYRWVGDACRVDGRGLPISEHDFLPRHVMGAYLEWFFDELTRTAPPGTRIIHHRTSAIDVVRQPDGRERVALAGGYEVVVRSVAITSGHTENSTGADRVRGARLASPYPVAAYDDRVVPGEPVVVAGMGLVAADVVAALTVGRGGEFRAHGDRLIYHASGREPVVQLFSRGGLPHCAKAVGIDDASDRYRPAIFTPEAVAALRRRNPGSLPLLDARRDILPLVFAEMQLRYYEQAALVAGGRQAADAVHRRFTDAYAAGDLEGLVSELADRYGLFEPVHHLFPADERTFTDHDDYQAFVYESVRADLVEALRPGGTSPTKAAFEVLRFVRDLMRQAVEFGGLSAASHVDFHSTIRGRLTRLVAGPPAVRSQQLLALMDAGVVQVPFGPSPVVVTEAEEEFTIRSVKLARPNQGRTRTVIRGYLEDPTVERSASALLARLHARGRLQPLRLEGLWVGSVELTPESHPVNVHGESEPNLWVFGAVTEGVRYFTHYVPSPKSRLRAVLDAQACAERMLE